MQGWKGIKIWKVKPFLLWAEHTSEGVFGLWVGCWVEEASSRAWRKFTIFISNTCASRMYAIFSFMQKKIAVWLWKKKDWQTLTVGIVRFPPSSFPPSSSSPCLPFPSHRCHFTASFHHSTSLGDGRGWLGGHHLCKGSKMERDGGGQVIGYEIRQLTNYFVSRSGGSVVCFRKKITLS